MRRKVIGVGLSLAAGLSFLAVPAGSASAETGTVATVAMADNGCEAWAYYPRKSGTKVVATAAGFCDRVIPGVLNLNAYLTRDGALLSSTKVSKVDRYKDYLAAETIGVSDPAGLQNYCNVVTFSGGDASENTFWDQDISCKKL